MAGSEGKISLSEGESTPRADAPQDEEEKREKVPEPRQSRVEETGEGGGEAVEGRAPAETSEKEKGQGQASSPAPEKFWVPERVQEVLKEAESFEDYKKKSLQVPAPLLRTGGRLGKRTERGSKKKWHAGDGAGVGQEEGQGP